MKSIRNSWLVTGTAALGLLAAACSSKTEDTSGSGGTGNTPGTTGGVASDTGGKAPTGGKSATGGSVPSTANPGNTGGAAPLGATGGSSSIDLATYCNGIFNGQSCGQTSLSADVRIVNMLLVLDESGSMKDPPTTGGASKWSIMYNALSSALSQTNVKENINFGLMLFPYGGDPTKSDMANECAVPPDPSTAVNIPIGPGTTTVPQILDKISNQTPAGGTPTADALSRAYDYFSTGDGRLLTGTRWVLLATDGGPNCDPGLTCDASRCTQNLDGNCPSTGTTVVNCCAQVGGLDYGFICLDDAATSSAITKLTNLGVRTFVIGIPGSDPYSATLNSMALAGKMPNPNATNGNSYYAISAASAQADLIAAFDSITTQLVKTCDIQLTATPTVTQDKVNIAIDCKLQHSIPPGTDPDAGNVDGFYIDYSQTPAHLKLVGAPCTQIQTVGATHVDVIAGCQTIN